MILRRFTRALISRANSNDVTNSACTNTTGAETQRCGLKAESAGGHQASGPPAPVPQQSAKQRDGADRLIRDLLSRLLLGDVARTHHEGGRDREHRRDVRSAH